MLICAVIATIRSKVNFTNEDEAPSTNLCKAEAAEPWHINVITVFFLQEDSEADDVSVNANALTLSAS